ncbi:hypothetical protein N1F89_20440, partial [Aquibium sp. A9E412]|uniref:hypothetical protein n=1 Tax=Aquibium sp. A9E412 TaxID=2976767 RepID=UPI0025B22928
DERRRLEAAVAAAEAALAERLAQAHAAELEAERARHAAEVEDLQRETGRLAGEAIAAGLAAMEQRLTDMATAVAARILGAALSDDLQRRAVDRLAQVIRDAMADREAVRVRVSGPAALIEALKPALGAHAAQVDFAETAGLDLAAQIDDSLYETRLAEWAEAVTEALS